MKSIAELIPAAIRAGHSTCSSQDSTTALSIRAIADPKVSPAARGPPYTGSACAAVSSAHKFI
jgi:hypothetical protein